MMQFTDSHCHLDDIAFSDNFSALLTQCQQLDIKRIIIPAIAPKNFQRVVNISQVHSTDGLKLYACLGIHPWFLQELDQSHLIQLSQLVKEERDRIIAIGEIGIDGAIAKNAEKYGQTPEENLAKQSNFFDYQLNLAKEQKLPVIIHHRQSHDKIIPFLKKYQLNKAGVIHGFSGSYQQATDYIDLGFKLGIGSTITYSRAKKTMNAIKRLPLTSLLLETDAPSMPLSKEVVDLDASYEQSQANSPINLIRIFKCLTAIRPESPSEIAEQIELNIDALFFS